MEDNAEPIVTSKTPTPPEQSPASTEVSPGGQNKPELEGSNSPEVHQKENTNSNLNVESIEGGQDVQVANQININNYNEIYGGREISNLEVLGREHYERLDEAELANRLRHFVFDEEEMTSVVDAALNSRFFLLAGQPSLGKGATVSFRQACMTCSEASGIVLSTTNDPRRTADDARITPRSPRQPG